MPTSKIFHRFGICLSEQKNVLKLMDRLSKQKKQKCSNSKDETSLQNTT